ncbi:hypothetical protein SAMN05444148_2755 [Winogradskyella jejuensis]|uniref:Uncharacterized protein n=2 Tax=Winogradskyella jejuensis TaxID=1089305 RepID=A0A1M5VMX2_9FLAO|nr:hypothetical protein SAMN05444148_2755 [Winogradskyella jejuensis]
MDKKILGNFITYFPIIAYWTYVFILKINSKSFWWHLIISFLIIGISRTIGLYIKNKGEVDENFKN